MLPDSLEVASQWYIKRARHDDHGQDQQGPQPQLGHVSNFTFGQASLLDRNFKDDHMFVADDDDFDDTIDRDTDYANASHDADNLHDEQDTFDDHPSGCDKGFEDGAAESYNVDEYDEYDEQMNARRLNRGYYAR